MKVVGYCRVSSQEQASEGLSLQMQQDKIRQYAQLHDLELVEIITDAGISAKNISGRPGLKKALDMIMSDHADGLVALKLDRVFRSTLDACETSKKFEEAGKHFILIQDNIDTGSAMGKFIFRLFSSLGELERDLTSERTKMILRSKKERSEPIGKPRFGLKAAGKAQVVDTTQQVIISKIQKLSLQGLSYRGIAQALNEQGILTKQAKYWTHKQISSILA